MACGSVTVVSLVGVVMAGIEWMIGIGVITPPFPTRRPALITRVVMTASNLERLGYVGGVAKIAFRRGVADRLVARLVFAGISLSGQILKISNQITI